MFCPFTQDEAPEPTYQAIFSFTDRPLASDDYGNRYCIFQVHFRQEELSPALRQAHAVGGMKRAELGTYFRVTTSRPPVRSTVIDDATLSDCITVRVDPV
jgi:hypothetical protein